jgi:hypothetical protein
MTTEQIGRELDEAVRAVLAKYATADFPGGCEFHGELRGVLQHAGHPETATGRCFTIGSGLPEGWKARGDAPA